jgi:hypothetical protein
MTPTAVAEMAIGTKMTDLTTDSYRTRIVSTASARPRINERVM